MAVVACTSCSKKVKIPDEKMGKKLACPHCRTVLPTGGGPVAFNAGAPAMALGGGGTAVLTPGQRLAAKQQKSSGVGMPGWLKATLIGGLTGLIWGAITGVIFAFIGVAEFFAGGSGDEVGAPGGAAFTAVFVVIMAVILALYYGFFGILVALVLALTQQAWAGYLVGGIFVVLSFFGGGFAGVISAFFFVGAVITAINNAEIR